MLLLARSLFHIIAAFNYKQFHVPSYVPGFLFVTEHFMILTSFFFSYLYFRPNDLWGFSPGCQWQYLSIGASWYLPAAQLSELERRWKAQHYPQAFTVLCGWSPSLLAQTQRINQSDTNRWPCQVLLQYINETTRFHTESRGAYFLWKINFVTIVGDSLVCVNCSATLFHLIYFMLSFYILYFIFHNFYFYVLCLMSYVLCLMSYVLCLVSDVSCLMSYVLCLTDILCLTSCYDIKIPWYQR